MRIDYFISQVVSKSLRGAIYNTTSFPQSYDVGNDNNNDNYNGNDNENNSDNDHDYCYHDGDDDNDNDYDDKRRVFGRKKCSNHYPDDCFWGFLHPNEQLQTLVFL